MTLMTGLRHDERLAGLVGLSGYLPLAAKAEAERHDANRETPIFLAHGTGDPMIPIARARQSRDALVALGHPVEWHEYPMPHSVCAAEIADLNRWLLRVLAAEPLSAQGRDHRAGQRWPRARRRAATGGRRDGAGRRRDARAETVLAGGDRAQDARAPRAPPRPSRRRP